MTPSIERYRQFPIRTAYGIFAISTAAIFVEAILVCCLGFAPGWANGWGSISKHTVFATFFSGAVLVMIVTAGTALLAFPCSLLQRLIKRDFLGWGAFASLVLVCAVVAVIFCVGIFPDVRRSIAKEWP
jgi:hypothetical protein